jgi:hypothetical protein
MSANFVEWLDSSVVAVPYQYFALQDGPLLDLAACCAKLEAVSKCLMYS